MHQDHDLLLIAGLAADDLTTSERTRAQALFSACSECRVIHDDLLAMTGAIRALRALPAPAAPRDFRISAEQAVRLRRTSWVARFLGPFAGPRSVARPLAATFTTLGLIGVFVAGSAAGMLGGAASMAAPESVPQATGASGVGVTAPGAVASAAPGAMFGPQLASSVPGDTNYGTKDNAGATAAPLTGEAGGGTTTGSTGTTGGAGSDRDAGADGRGRLNAFQSPTNVLFIGSLALLGAGLILFGLRFAGRRLH